MLRGRPPVAVSSSPTGVVIADSDNAVGNSATVNGYDNVAYEERATANGYEKTVTWLALLWERGRQITVMGRPLFGWRFSG